MTKREVIDYFKDINVMYNNPNMLDSLSDMIDELLKEREPVKPKYEDLFGNRVAFCGNCNSYLVRYKYCPICGREVNWDE